MIREYLRQKQKIIDDTLRLLFEEENPASRTLYEAMQYSLLAGGKRIRPSLFLLLLEILGKDSSRFLPEACALECVHTYSLIHDDLPGMDNDDYRRGKLTNHKVFGTGVAIMAGDALLTAAFEILSRSRTVSCENKCRMIEILAAAAGANGMVAGQVQDIEAENRVLNLRELRFMDYCKTGCLLCAPVDMAGILGEASPQEKEKLHAFGKHLGLLFQITDDLLDENGHLDEMGKEPGKDREENKSTYVTILGKEKAAALAAEEADKARESLCLPGRDISLLYELIDFILHRTA